jgi:hypothetical protein
VAPRRTPDGRRAPASRPEPERSADFDHLTLASLRTYRRALEKEEGRVSYWRRILHARLDVVRAGSGSTRVDVATLRPVLAETRAGSGRLALVDVVQADDDVPTLPDLAELWDRDVPPGDDVATAAFLEDLETAETQLSAYRAALHRRLAAATGELVARYREEPALCLSALPLPPPRSGPGTVGLPVPRVVASASGGGR